MKLGANSVLFGGYDLETAFRCISLAGYHGIELSAIGGMSEHLVLDRWQEIAPVIKRLKVEYNLELLAMEQPLQDPTTMETAFQAAAEIEIPVINCGPGGKSGDQASVQESIDSLGQLARMAEKYGVVLCVKAHVGAAIDNTPTTLQVMAAIDSPFFGIDMDPSHIHRAGENPVDALQAVISRVKHIHIRDCLGREQGPGKPEMQANGRGDIDLLGYVDVLGKHGYEGPVDLEIIGAKEYALENCCTIAAESAGYLKACLEACKRARDLGLQGAQP